MIQETGSIVLEPRDLAQIALYMYRQYKEAMKPPVFMVLTFEEWLQRVSEEPTEAEQ